MTKLGTNGWRWRVSYTIISFWFCPVLRNWYLCHWIRKQPKFKSSDTWSRCDLMNINMQFLYLHWTRDVDPLANSSSMWSFTHGQVSSMEASNNTSPLVYFCSLYQHLCMLLGGGDLQSAMLTKGPGTNTGHQSNQKGRIPQSENPNSRLDIRLCGAFDSPCFYKTSVDGYLDLTNSFCFHFHGFCGINQFARLPFSPPQSLDCWDSEMSFEEFCP